MDAFDGLLRETLTVTAMLCLPILVVATLVGTTVAVLQAATQVQEQTLTLLPKLISVGIAVATCGAFGMHLCAGLFNDILRSLPAIASGQ